MPYTCREYREEMQLLALQRELAREDLSPERRREVQGEIDRLKREMGMDD